MERVAMRSSRSKSPSSKSRASGNPRGAESRRYFYRDEALHERWDALHRCDREPWPNPQWVSALATRHPLAASELETRGGPRSLAGTLQEAWRTFHAGDYPRAIELGVELGPFGAAVASKAAAVQSLSAIKGSAPVLELLTSAAARGERAVDLLPRYVNAHYTLALVLGRYGQHISILRALAEGLAGRVESRLKRTLELEPEHAEAHVALGLYHAEIIHQVGTLAGFAYGVSSKVALEHMRRAHALAPSSPVIAVEYARGLMLLDPDDYRREAQALHERVARCKPLDAMEELYVKRANSAVG
jgi:hypothetical protein